jgi:hypothetical protein
MFHILFVFINEENDFFVFRTNIYEILNNQRDHSMESIPNRRVKQITVNVLDLVKVVILYVPDFKTDLIQMHIRN